MQGHSALCVRVLLTLFFLFSPFLLPFPLFENAATDASQGPGESVFAQLLCTFSLCPIVHGLTLSEAFF